MSDTPSQPLFDHIDCLRLYVPNLDKAFEFYQKLGFKIVWRDEHNIGLLFGDEITELVLQDTDEREETDIKVKSVEKAVAKFVEAGGKVLHGPFDIKIGKCAVIEDPWGNKMIILDSSKGTFITNQEGTIIGQNEPEQSL